MLIFPDAPTIWHDCNRCSNLTNCEDPFPTSGVCPHPGHILLLYYHPCHPTTFHSFYSEAIAQNTQLASIFARWQVKHPTNDNDFAAIRNYHLAHPQDKVATSLVCDILAFRMSELRKKCHSYYAKSEEEIDDAFVKAVFFALTALTPSDVAACSARGGHWTLAYMDAMKFAMRAFLKETYLDLDDQEDDAFRVIFEREWRLLFKDCLGHRFDFLIIPRLSYQHMTRYQELPSGDAIIRRTVSTYLIHQCFFYPHISTDWKPNLAYEALWPLIQRSYEPLIGATVARAAANLQLNRAEAVAKSNLRKEIETIFKDFASQFDFSRHAPDNFKGRGVLGLNEDKKAQAEIDGILILFGFSERSTDVDATPFAHYVKKKLDWWVKDKYPPTQDILTINTNTVTGADGQTYLTIKGAAQRFGVSEARLRNIDRAGALTPVRARDVAPTTPLLAPDIRLYANTLQMRKDVEIAEARSKTHSLGLSGKELNRKQASVLLGVNYNTLRDLENQSLITPTKRKQSVVYDEATLTQAKAILEKQQQKKTRKKRRT